MIKIQNKQVIDVCEWDRIVEQIYGRTYSFQQQDGCKERQHVSITVPDQAYDYPNDTIPEKVNGDEMGVSFSSWLARDPKQPLDSKDEWERGHGLNLWWERNFYPDVQMVANDLHAKGLIPVGEYEIDIDW